MQLIRYYSSPILLIPQKKLLLSHCRLTHKLQTLTHKLQIINA